MGPVLPRLVGWLRSRPGPILSPGVPFVLSVGALAWGGRAKTPLVAALSCGLTARGLRVGVVARSLEGRDGRPRLLRSDGGEGAPWRRRVLGEGEPLLAPAAARAHGAEACWLALAQPGPCAVAGTLDAALAHIRARGGVLDVVILDDAAQARVPRHADLLVLGRGDPGAAWLRESSEAVHRARWVVGLDAGEGTWLVRRRVGALRDLADGQRRDAGATRRVVMAGVGDPLSVARLASDAGVTVAAHIHVPDHGEPGPWARLRLRGRPALVTEKDALRWAAERPPSPGTLVLGVVLDGVDPLAVAVASAAA